MKPLGIKTIPGSTAWLRGDGAIPSHDIGPRERAPRLALVADLRGQELNGMFVLSRLAAFLRDIEAGRRRDLRLRERVLVIPSIGDAAEGQGANIQRIAWLRWAMIDAVVAATQAAYYRVTIHPSPDTEEMPQVRLYAPNDDERASACLFGLPAVIEQPLELAETPVLVRAWRLCGGENFALHAGQAGGLQTVHCESLFHALVAFLDRTGIVEGLRLANEEEDLEYFGLRQVFLVLAEQSGIFSSRQEVGRWVQAGEELGQVYDGFTGGARARVIAPVAGLLASLRRQPLLREGDLVARILTPARTIRCERARPRGERHERRFGFRP
ncbi:MAG: succinylglutamate desuccinylase [Candidatus Contendobacter sp.]|nr:succinylglutamate desuccinylase [Candidatus Contendobacter sp.]MDS4060548.1 succinylglutamate desuccinylase [Candidatus Contendobacter sp.]